MISFLRTLLGIYAVLLAVDFALPFITNTRQGWMLALGRICEPGAALGRKVVDRLIPDRKTVMDLGRVTAFLLCILLRLVLSFFH